jgi:hypothetical protein
MWKRIKKYSTTEYKIRGWALIGQPLINLRTKDKGLVLVVVLSSNLSYILSQAYYLFRVSVFIVVPNVQDHVFLVRMD